MMQQQHLGAIAKLAKAQQVTTIIDNSWASPLFQKPLTQGIDIVLHSASKYISGHSDTVAGVVASSQTKHRFNYPACQSLPWGKVISK